jgi:hypothetical protein
MCQLQCTLGIPGQLSLSTWGNGMRREPLRLLLGIVLALASFTGLVALMSYTIPDALGIDWRLTYRPAALALLRGDSPYGVGVAPEAPFFAAPWGLLPLLPLAWLPAQTGRLVVMLAGVVVFAYAAYRLGASPFAMAVFLVSPPVVHCIVNANIEWLPLLGFALPPRLGLLLVTIKPQTGVAVAVFWLVEGWRKGGWREIVSVSWPLATVFVVSVVAFGWWPLQLPQVLGVGASFNSSLWPFSIPVGLTLLVTAIQKRKAAFAMAASPFLSPYVLFHGWSSAVIALVRNPMQLIASVVGLWIVFFLRLLA